MLFSRKLPQKLLSVAIRVALLPGFITAQDIGFLHIPVPSVPFGHRLLFHEEVVSKRLSRS